MLEWLFTWVTTKATGLVFKTIFSEDFAKDLIKDYGKDFCKYLPGKLGSFTTGLFQQEPLQKAVVMALTEFLKLVQLQLRVRCKLDDNQIQEYTIHIKKFIRDKTVKQTLGRAFDIDCEDLDPEIFKQRWRDLKLKLLPKKFNWQSVTEQYLLKVQGNISESEELRYIIELQSLRSIAENTKEIAGVTKDFDLRKYQEAIRERYVNLNFDSLDTTGSAYNALTLWKVFIPQSVQEIHQILPELPREYLKKLQESNQLDVEIDLERIEELERYKSSYIEQPIRSVLEIIQDKSKYSNRKYIVILGDPGSGKSTLLQYLALKWVENTLDQDKLSQPIPLLIELRTYVRDRIDGICQNFLEFYHKSPNCLCHLNQHKLEQQLKTGNALVMFDGLDEVFDPAKREEVITAIHRFTNNYPDVQVIVTSRVVGYKPQRLRNAEFSHFMLQDLNKEQIQTFINKWHNETFSDEIDKVRKRERLKKGIENSKAISELAGNPLLLTMMAILNRNQELPRDRAELYNQASRVLLHQWDVERALVEDKRLDPKTIDYKDKQAMLRQVAYHMQTNNRGLAGNLIKENNLERILKEYLRSIEVDKPREVTKLIIHQLRTRNFMLCYLGADYYAFVHRTFLEYFCGWEFVWQFKETQTLSIEKLKTQVFGKHWMDESWHEVLRLIAGMIEARFVGEIIEYLMKIDGEEEKFKNLFLAAECLGEVRNRKVILPTGKKLLSKLKPLINYGTEKLIIYQYTGEDNSRITKICIQAVIAITNTWKDNPETLTWLKQRTNDNKSGKVRRLAVKELARGWKDKPETLIWLKKRTNDHNSDVRGAAVQELAYGWKDHSETLTIVKQRAKTDKCESVRSEAIQELVCSWKDNPETLALLKELVSNDDSGKVRSLVVKELARGWKDNPETLKWLKQCTNDDNDSHVRTAAVQELARGWKDHPKTLEIVKKCAKTDKCESVRGAAVQELARRWKDYPETFAIVKQCVTTDENWGVRRLALKELARAWKDYPETLFIVKQCAISDKSGSVRGAAEQELTRLWRNSSNTVRISKK